MNEFGDRKLCTDAILNVINAGGEALAFADDDGVRHLEVLRPGLFAKMLAAGTVEKFADARALARAYKPKSRSKPSRYSSENDVLIEKSVKYTDFFLLSIVYV